MVFETIYISRRERVGLGNVIPDAAQSVLHIFDGDEGQLGRRRVHIILPTGVAPQELPQTHEVGLNE